MANIVDEVAREYNTFSESLLAKEIRKEGKRRFLKDHDTDLLIMRATMTHLKKVGDEAGAFRDK